MRIHTLGKDMQQRLKQEQPDVFPITSTVNFNINMLREQQREQARSRSKKAVRLTAIEPITGIEAFLGANPHFVGRRKGKRSDESRLAFEGETGCWKLTFSDGEFAYLTSILFGHKLEIINIWTGSKRLLYKVLAYKSKVAIKASKLVPGIWKASDQMGTLMLMPMTELSAVPPIHPVVDEVRQQVDRVFGRPEIYTRFGMPGKFTMLLVGEPGTGKTTILTHLAHEFSPEVPVVFANCVSSAYMTMKKAAASNTAVVIILEDAETQLNDGAGVLNFLDGVDTPPNKKGTVLLLSTNHPHRISRRILERPGRIDMSYAVGPLEGEWAERCARMFLPEEEVDVTSHGLRKAFDKTTGAQIKTIIQASQVVAIEQDTPITDAVLAEARKRLKQHLTAVAKAAEVANALKVSHAPKFGFTTAGDGDGDIAFVVEDDDPEEADSF